MLFSRCSLLNLQVTIFDWELNSLNLNIIFLSVQCPTRHCLKRICNHLHLFLSPHLLNTNARSLSDLSLVLGSNAKRIRSHCRSLDI